MNVLALLEYLDEELTKASNVPLTGKRLVDAEKCKDIIRELRINLPEDLTEAEGIIIERERILDEAQHEAQSILDDAEAQFERRLEEHEVTRAANKRAQEIIGNAKSEAADIQDEVLDYADRVMGDAERALQALLAEIAASRGGIGREA